MLLPWFIAVFMFQVHSMTLQRVIIATTYNSSSSSSLPLLPEAPLGQVTSINSLLVNHNPYLLMTFNQSSPSVQAYPLGYNGLPFKVVISGIQGPITIVGSDGAPYTSDTFVRSFYITTANTKNTIYGVSIPSETNQTVTPIIVYASSSRPYFEPTHMATTGLAGNGVYASGFEVTDSGSQPVIVAFDSNSSYSVIYNGSAVICIPDDGSASLIACPLSTSGSDSSGGNSDDTTCLHYVGNWQSIGFSVPNDTVAISLNFLGLFTSASSSRIVDSSGATVAGGGVLPTYSNGALATLVQLGGIKFYFYIAWTSSYYILQEPSAGVSWVRAVEPEYYFVCTGNPFVDQPPTSYYDPPLTSALMSRGLIGEGCNETQTAVGTSCGTLCADANTVYVSAGVFDCQSDGTWTVHGFGWPGCYVRPCPADTLLPLIPDSPSLDTTITCVLDHGYGYFNQTTTFYSNGSVCVPRCASSELTPYGNATCLLGEWKVHNASCVYNVPGNSQGGGGASCTGNPAASYGGLLNGCDTAHPTASGTVCPVACSNGPGQGFYECNNGVWIPSFTPEPIPACYGVASGPAANTVLYGALGGMGGVIIISSLICVIFCRRRCARFDPKSVKMVDPSEVLIGDILGEGNEAVVHKASWHGADIAVKIPKNSKVEFREEIRFLDYLGHHPRVISYLGYSLKPREFLMMELMTGGSVEQALIKLTNMPLMIDSSLPDDVRLRNLQTLVQIALDCSAAITHMHARGTIHNDIAARNFLVMSTTYRAVVSDFGMSCLLKAGQDHTVFPNDQLIPIRWCSPETLVRRIQSRMTDVYMFGMFLYELIARRQPFESETSLKVILKAVTNPTNTLQPAIPGYCPVELALIMRQCWSFNPTKRPRIHEINKKLAGYLSQLQDAQYFSAVYQPVDVNNQEYVAPQPQLRIEIYLAHRHMGDQQDYEAYRELFAVYDSSIRSESSSKQSSNYDSYDMVVEA